MVTDQHWATGAQIKHSKLSDCIRERTMTGTERSSVLGGRRKEKVRYECVVVERSKLVRQPLGLITESRTTRGCLCLCLCTMSSVFLCVCASVCFSVVCSVCSFCVYSLSVCLSVCREYQLWLAGAWPSTASSNDVSATSDLVSPPSRVYDVSVLHKLRPATPAQLCQCYLCTFNFAQLTSELITGKDSSLKWPVKCWVRRRTLLSSWLKCIVCQKSYHFRCT